MRFVTASLLGALWLSGGALADDSAKKKIAPYWIKSQTGCEIWNSEPEPNETVTWSGRCVNGKAHGRGRLVWYANGVITSNSATAPLRHGKDGSGYEDTAYYTAAGKFDGRYRGQTRDGEFHGKGRYDWPNGDRYVGQWKDGDQHGRGTFIWADGGSYTGQWKNGKEHGKGVQRLADGDTYRGDFRNGERDGDGVYIDRAPGTGVVARIKGQFRKGVQHGFIEILYGPASNSPGQTFIGFYQDGKTHGTGTATAPDGSFFTGEYRDDNKWAGRRYVAKDGRIYTWRNGKQIEPGEPYGK